MKNTKNNFSTYRTYVASIFESGSITKINFTLDELINNQGEGKDSEFFYALQEHGDKLLDLRREESIYFQPNRDQPESKAIILRVQ